MLLQCNQAVIEVDGTMTGSKLVIGYARVSSREQADDSNALTQQIDRLECAGAEQVFFDVESGTKDNRPELMKVLALAKQGLISKLICTRLDRMGRSRKTTYDLVSDLYRDYKVEIKFLDDPAIDLTQVGGGMVLAIMAEFAQMETDRLRERVKNGIAYRRKQHWACGFAPWGYVVVDNKYQLDHSPFLCLLDERPPHYQELSQVEDQIWLADTSLLPGYTKAQICRDTVETFLELRRIRATQRYLAQRYGFSSALAAPARTKGSRDHQDFAWSNSGLKKWLINPVLQGHTAYGQTEGSGGKVKIPRSEWQIVKDTHPEDRLVSDVEADEISHILRLVKETGGKIVSPEKIVTPLTGLIFCATCKRKATLKNTRGSDRRYYGCRHSGIDCPCKGNTKMVIIEQYIVNEIVRRAQEISRDPKEAAQPAITSPFIEELRPQLDTLNAIANLHLQPALLQLKNNLEQQIQEELARLEKVDIRDAAGEVIIRHPVASDINFWFTLTLAEREVIYPRLLERLEVRDGGVTLVQLKV